MGWRGGEFNTEALPHQPPAIPEADVVTPKCQTDEESSKANKLEWFFHFFRPFLRNFLPCEKFHIRG